jgi:hypothetical protein
VAIGIAWANKGIQPVEVPDGSFQYTKLSSVGSFFNWGFIELRADQMKRTKNSRKMHMVFNVQSGTVEVKVHENEFTVHKNGVWQVPRGELNFFHSAYHSFLLRNVLSSASTAATRHLRCDTMTAALSLSIPQCNAYLAQQYSLRASPSALSIAWLKARASELAASSEEDPFPALAGCGVANFCMLCML